MSEIETQAKQIAEISSLSYETALRALEADGPARETALSILTARDRYAKTNAKLAESKNKLAELIPA